GVWRSAYFRCALDLADDRPPEAPRWMSKAWARRVRARGPVAGTASYTAALLLPPAVVVPARRLGALRRADRRMDR
ncbi:MAG: hypothetical protein ABW075_08705, partial [Aeromicrobium sp.]